MTSPHRHRAAFWSYSVFLFALCGVAAVRQAEGPWSLPRAHAQDTKVGKRYALVVGVKTYRAGQPLPPLEYTENDAQGLAEVFTNGGYTVTLMTQSVGRVEGKENLAPLSDYIRDKLDVILGNPFLKPEDTVVVAFAGHGVKYDVLTEDSKTKVTKKTAEKFYFCPADADISKVVTAGDITERNRLLDLGEVYTALGTCKAGSKVLLVDACRNDPTKPAGNRAASITLPPLPPPPGGAVAYFSCSPNQLAIEDKTLKHGVFFHNVIQALKGDADTGTKTRPADGQITLAELTEHVSRGTYDFVSNKYGSKQTPEVKGEIRLSIPLIEVALVPEGTRAGEERTFSDLKIKMNWCPPTGSKPFTMGSPKSEEDRDEDEDQVEVTLSRGFWLGQTEVTQGVWESVMGTTPWKGKSFVKEGANYPATYVSHGGNKDGSIEKDSALEFCAKLTERERKAGRLPGGMAYRLPTEAEWAYACRAGTTTMYSFGSDATKLSDHAWWGAFSGDGNAKTELYAHQVGTKRPNAWGLYDMHGNVVEWCGDWYAEKLAGGRDPRGPSEGSDRVIRGGCWLSDAGGCRSAARRGGVPGSRGVNLGFRPVLSPSN